MLTKADIALIVFFIFTAAMLMAVPMLRRTSKGASVIISVNGAVVETLSINKETEYKINGKQQTSNIVKISGGKASMLYADCPDGLCVKQRPIEYPSEIIVCLPNRVVIEVKGRSSNKNAVDEITH